MLKECTDIFRQMMEKSGESLVLADYIPADGTYILVQADGAIKNSPMRIAMDKKTRTIDRSHRMFKQFCYWDYQSRLIDMNKPQDPNKIIHSNNYLSFFVKKESLVSGKLTEKAINDYYQVLANPGGKYTKSKQAELYKALEGQIGEPDLNVLEQCKGWIINNIFRLDELRIDISGKDYIKIFFEADDAVYEREAERYIVPNIYNSNDYNEEIDGQICGFPNNNMGMNAKKPYLPSRTRKIQVPRLISKEEAVVQKQFFDYLMNFAAAGRYNIYIDLEKETIKGYVNDELPQEQVRGYFLRIQKGKELEIHSQDVVPYYDYRLDKPFEYENILQMFHRKHPELLNDYKQYKDKKEMARLINEVLFSKVLTNNYFTPADKLSINAGYLKRSLLMARESLFDWLYKGLEGNVYQVLRQVTLTLVKGSIQDGYDGKAARQFNLRWSLLEYFHEGGEGMASVVNDCYQLLEGKIRGKGECEIVSDEEYYFAIGQLAGYFIRLNKAKKTPQSLINPYINAGSDNAIKERLRQYYKKYNYTIISGYKAFNRMYDMVIGYTVSKKVNQDMIIAGYLHDNMLFSKEDKSNE